MFNFECFTKWLLSLCLVVKEFLPVHSFASAVYAVAVTSPYCVEMTDRERCVGLLAIVSIW